MECKFCGRELKPDAKHPNQKYCSEKCRNRFVKGLFHLRPGYVDKSLADWVREAAECNLDYGTYRALRNAGKTFEELKATAANRQMPAHAHGRGRRYDS